MVWGCSLLLVAGHVTPAAARSRWSAHSAARTNDLGGGEDRRMLGRQGAGAQQSVHAAHLLAATVVTGLCVRAPGLIWVRGPTRVRRQDDRWGVPSGARARGLLGPATDQPWRQGARGRWPRHICLPMGGHAAATSVRPPGAGVGPRPGRGRRR